MHARSMFRDQTRTVTALFSRCATPLRETGKSWKLIVEVVTSVPANNSREVLGVLLVQVPGRVPSFFELNDHEKLEKSLEYLMLGVKKVAQEKGWQIAPFVQTQEKIRSLSFINEWVWKKPIFNKEKSLSAEVFVEHKLAYASISVRFRNKEKLIVQSVELVKERPNEFIFYPYLGTFSWLNSTSVELVSQDGEKRLTARYSIDS